jgi:small subunit ribosomal protein S1
MDPNDLASLYQAQPVRRKLVEGTKVKATVRALQDQVLLLDLGGKAEGIIDKSEAPGAKAGDEIEAWVVWTDGVETRLSTKLTGATAASFLEQAMDAEIPVEGLVKSRNSGGYTVDIGGVSAFCPLRLIDRIPDENLDSYVGKTFSFLVIDTDEKTVLSRKALLDKDAAEKSASRLATLTEGEVMRGVVSSVQPFGVFVEAEGVEGLVPRSEASWDRGAELASLFTRGQAVEVRVLAIDRDKGKLTFSVKDPGASPWSRVGVDFVEAGLYTGKVVKAEPYGVFVDLAPGVGGLLHKSSWPGALPEVGQAIDVRIKAIDHGRRRLDLASIEAPAEPTRQDERGQTVHGVVEDVLGAGVRVRLQDGRLAWLPAGEADLPAGTVLAQRFRKGRPLQARVAGVDARRDQVNLTQRESTDEESERSWRAHAAKEASSSGGFGTLGDLLGGARRGR